MKFVDNMKLKWTINIWDRNSKTSYCLARISKSDLRKRNIKEVNINFNTGI